MSASPLDQSASPMSDMEHTPFSSSSIDGSMLGLEDHVEESSPLSDPITITTTLGSGPNKRKEVMTLPLPPGALPPRKRAKTKDEKEQRRIERIMRNRQAAHASREKKRRHVEDLEKKCVDLETENSALQTQVKSLKSNHEQVSDQSAFFRRKLSELSDMIALAQANGSLESIDTLKFLKEVDANTISISQSPVTTSTTIPSALIIDNNGDSDTNSEIGSLPSLSSSVANSPSNSSLDIMIKLEDTEDDNVVISVPGEEYPLFGLLDYRSHHPAAMMCLSKHDQQRRLSMSQPRNIPTL